MKIKTSELIDDALDWAVAKADGYLDTMLDTSTGVVFGLTEQLEFSSNWKQGGPIIERERIVVGPHGATNWVAQLLWDAALQWFGPTLLIAAMRCFVASRLGNEVEIPDELL